LKEFFESCQFSESNECTNHYIDEERFYLFACYCCRSEDAKTTLIANHIRQKANDIEQDLIYRAVAKQTLDLILEIATTGMLKSLAEIEYTEDFYTS
jgi:hypothetical protein